MTAHPPASDAAIEAAAAIYAAILDDPEQAARLAQTETSGRNQAEELPGWHGGQGGGSAVRGQTSRRPSLTASTQK